MKTLTLLNLDKELRIGAAVSGGADSMVMLDLLKRDGYKTVAINIEHGIRGEGSVSDSKFVKDFCKKAEIECLSYIVDAPKYAKERGISLELAARELRYQIFDGLLGEKRVDVVALAHHADDQAETVLMRLFRGSGVKGMAGIRDRKGYVHPLLGYKKDEILSYATENEVPFVVDKTNFDNVYTRNFIRNEVIPLLKTKYPSVSDVLVKSGQIFGEIDDFLEGSAVSYKKSENGVFFEIEDLNVHTAVKKVSIKKAIAALGIDKDIEYTHLESILGLLGSQNGKMVTLPFGLKVYKEYSRIYFARGETGEEFCFPFDVNRKFLINQNTYSFVKTNKIEHGAFDFDKVPYGAVIRNRNDGDVFKRYGGGTKPLAEYLTDIKIPKRQRDLLPVLANGNEILAVLGVEISEQIKVTDDTKTIYKIQKSGQTT